MADEHYDHDTYLSPYTWRYGSAPMRAHFSEVARRRIWRRIWLALARAQARAGLVRPDQLADLEAHIEHIDLARAHAIEAEIKHDLMAEVRCFAEQCPVGGGVIHLGATSMDIEDNAEALRTRGALDLLIGRLRGVLDVLASLCERHAADVTMAFTHLQPAEPTTLGYRFAQYAQDLLADLDTLEHLRQSIRGKGLKGACGTAASYHELLEGSPLTPRELEHAIMAELELEPFEVATQTYPRKQDYTVLAALAGLAQSLSRLAFDCRMMQSPVIGDVAEPFGARQVGSSAMPFKRNPIDAENIGSMARLLAALPRVAWDNAAQGILERTLDDSANRRTTLPEAFLMADEMLVRTGRILAGLRVDTGAGERLLERFGTFAATERLLMVAARRGGDRQHLHEVIREHALEAWAALERGEHDPLAERLASDERLTALVEPDAIRRLLDARSHVGDAPERARDLTRRIRERLAIPAPHAHPQS